MTELPILLPSGYTPLIAVGDTVKTKDRLAEKKGSGNSVTINIAEEFSLSPEKVGKTIRKNPGESIEPGDVIAVRKGFLGMGEQRVISSVSGTILTYERRTAELTIQIGTEKVESGDSDYILSPADGKVTACDEEKILLETSSNAMVPLSGLGESVQAELMYIKHDPISVLPLHLLSPDSIGKIVVTDTLDRDGLMKAVGIDVAGVIVLQLQEKDEHYLVEKEVSMPVLTVSADDFKKIAKWSGKTAYIEGKKKNIVLLQT